MRLLPIAPEGREFWSSFNYSCALRDILLDETKKRIIKKVKNSNNKDAEKFLKSWLRIHYKRVEKSRYFKLGDTEKCNQLVRIMHEELKILGIRIP